MNQSLIFAFIAIALNWRRATPASWAFLLVTWVASAVQAQTDSQFIAPPLPGSAPIQTRWPQESYAVDPQLRPANYDAPAASPLNATEVNQGGTIETWIDSAGPAVDGFKETVLNQAQGLMAMVTSKSGKGTAPNIAKMLSSLALVLGGYFAVVWITRKLSPASNSRLPADVVDVLGRTPFGQKQSLQLVRLGNKLLLLLEGPDGTHPIGEITDPQEVHQLTTQCKSGKAFNFGRPARNRSRSTSTSPLDRGNSSNVVNSATAIPLMTNESVHQSLTNVLRTLEHANRQPTRGNSFEA